ncbi:26S proteasome regulatory subunit [Haematococcus lacustris]
MATPRVVEFLEGLQTEYPDAQSDVSELASLYQRKLWHQITVKIDELIRSEGPLNSGDVPLRLFNSFILDFAQKINLMKFAQFAVHATKSMSSPTDMAPFLQAAIQRLDDMKLTKAKEPMLFLRMHVAQHLIELGQLAEAKALVEAGQEELQGVASADPAVSAAVFYVSSLYHKATADFAAFYKASLMYLSFVTSDSLPQDFKQKLAVDISLAALLGDSIYSFGQLLQHPICSALDASPFSWLHALLRTFNDGDIAQYDQLCLQHSVALNAQPALVANERKLREKLTVMSLLDLIWRLPAEQRVIPLSTIAARTQLSIDGVEFLLMKALALHLIEGSLDQVDEVVAVSWVAPRILTKQQLADLRDRLDGWIAKVDTVAVTLQSESVGVAVQA